MIQLEFIIMYLYLYIYIYTHSIFLCAYNLLYPVTFLDRWDTPDLQVVLMARCLGQPSDIEFGQLPTQHPRKKW